MTQPPAKRSIRSTARLRLHSSTRGEAVDLDDEAHEAARQQAEAERAETEKQPHRWTSIAGLVVAVGVAAAANVTTLVVAFNGQTNASIQSAKEFRRNQQQTQFVDFINAASALQDAGFKYQGAIAFSVVNQKIDDNAAEPLRKAAESQLNTLRTKLAVGGQHVGDAGGES
ncbi:hypothetical protein AAHS21_31775 [Mycobacterium sp. 050272]|uniref:hypothetical protein n=1 Tax=Mycobacterium sp. 050272 TaxID=3142488 RepID=UPI0031977016